MQDGFLTVGEVQERLNIARPTVYKYVKEGRLKLYHSGVGRASLFKREEVDRLAEITADPEPGADIYEPDPAELREIREAIEANEAEKARGFSLTGEQINQRIAD